jgi:hypothetical protein
VEVALLTRHVAAAKGAGLPQVHHNEVIAHALYAGTGVWGSRRGLRLLSTQPGPFGGKGGGVGGNEVERISAAPHHTYIAS